MCAEEKISLSQPDVIGETVTRQMEDGIKDDIIL